jgi:hypothetical protein
MSFQRASGEIRVSFFVAFFVSRLARRSISEKDLFLVYGWVLNSLFNNSIVSLKLDFAAQKKGGTAVSAVWTLVYLLAPCPAEPRSTPTHTGGASGS